MRDQNRLWINLSSQPLRNRRFFALLCFLLIGGALGLFLLGGRLYLDYHDQARRLTASLGEAEQKIGEARGGTQKLEASIRQEEEENQKKVARINSLIFRKSFSWVEFLHSLETSLPDSCTIVSLTPTVVGDARIEVRIRVAYPQLEELMTFITNLESMTFKDIVIRSERQSEQGVMIAEISLDYEKNV